MSVPRPLPQPPSQHSHSHTHTHSHPHSATPATLESDIPQAASTVSTSKIEHAQGGEPIVCNGCKHGLEETGDSVVVSFGSSLWHVDCRCAKCHNLVEHDTNLLLLSDGSPVCENCSYICSVCQKPISNEAIVTGDESYHADCFRCRSCLNKIEELIFAKTSQGIWCMACHNERVARSRKHAEAKRSRSVRRDKDSRTTKNRGDRSAPSTAPTTGNTDTTFDASESPIALEGASSSSLAARPLPPSPYTTGAKFATPPSNATDSSPSTMVTSSWTKSTSSAARSQFASENGGPDIAGSSSLNSLSSFAQSSSSSTPSHSRQTSAQTATNLDRDAGQSSLVSDPVAAASAGGTRSPRLGASDLAADIDGDVNDDENDEAGALPSSRQGSLSAPDKAMFRRSGFYGTLRRPSIEEEDVAVTDIEPDSLGGLSEPQPPQRSRTPPSPPSSAGSFLPELHHSMSFYDPDTLLFLNHVATESTPPRGLSTSAVRRSYSNGSANTQADHEVEHLSPNIGAPGDNSSEDDQPRERNPKSELASKLRESIRMSREGKDAAGMGMDVDLVEMLLSELDGTRKEMQDLQAKYNAFRRASRSAFEGFSMAREEYDKEVAARRDTENKMDVLRVKFAEQALKLAAVDKEQRTTEALKRQSKDLRSSVSGMEQHLSHLRAEVELSTAQMEELADKPDRTRERPSSAGASFGDMERSLNARLEAVKDNHRREIEALVSERDGLTKEIAELRQTRDIFAEEAALLNLQNSTLADQNVEATRRLDLAREAAANLHSPRQLLGPDKSRPGHQHSGSGSSVTLVQRAPLSATKMTISSPVALLDDGEQTTHRLVKVDHEPRSVAKKFGWGKGKHDQPRPNHAPAPSTSKALPSPRPNGIVEPAPRSHSFQQTSILRPVRCEYCSDKMWGLNEVRCTGCGSYSHAKCAGYLQTPCTSTGAPSLDDTATFGPLMFGNDLTAQARAEERQVPIVVSKCIGAVEAYGMNYEGIYRKTGGSGQTKLITACFERGQDFNLEDTDKYNDLAAVTSCMKNFFRSLPDPLFTHDRHEAFVACAEMPEGEGRLVALEQALYNLPEVHFHTARMLFGHLHRVHLRSSENKMTPANLGVVFGPTVLRSRLPSREFSDMGFKAKLVELMVEQQPRLFAKPYRSPPDEPGSP